MELKMKNAYNKSYDPCLLNMGTAHSLTVVLNTGKE